MYSGLSLWGDLPFLCLAKVKMCNKSAPQQLRGFPEILQTTSVDNKRANKHELSCTV